MNHITQEPKSMQLAVELEYRREYEAAYELRTMQALIADLEAQLHAIGAISVKQSIRPQAQPDTAAHQEPVAWKWRYKDGELSSVAFDTREQCESNSDGVAGEAVPLYAAPRPTENLHCKSNQKRLATLWGYVKQDLARQLLTNEQIVAIANKSRAAVAGDAGYILPISFARAIEEAHGITGGQQ